MNFDNQVNKSSEEGATSPTKRTSRALFDSPKATAAVTHALSAIKLSPKKIDPVGSRGSPSPTRLGALRGQHASTQSSQSTSTSTSQSGEKRRNEIEVLRELSEEELAIIRGRESKRLATMSQLYFLDHYFDLLKYLNNRRLRTDAFHAQHDGLDEAQRGQLWKQQCGRERAYLRKRRTKVKHGDFKILAQVGQGGYGSVHLAQKRDTKEIVALKVMSKALLHKMDEIRHILTERDILTNAKSDWLVNLLYSFQDTRNVYLAMEYVAGGDFRTLLTNSGVLHDPHARFYIAEMFLSVDELHKLGYIHRDLKPENFLISATGHIKLTDFGLASGMINNQKIESMRVKLTQAGEAREMGQYSTLDRQNMYRSLRAREPTLAYSVVGSPDYMAPEVLKGLEYNHTVDYWSLGCMLFECLSGYPPFSGESVNDTWANLKNWRAALKRPHYDAPEHQEFNLRDEAWELITAVVCSDRRRLQTLSEVQRHVYFSGFDFKGLRSMKVPFKPKLASETDHGYFDDFESAEDMSKYKEVHDKQAAIEKLAERGNGMKKTAFVGFTYKHGKTGDMSQFDTML
ncbi:kinase-like domain-containing protein [Protomyces lactucae-debilis]|uniref:non-specific serine/threonine protein kinase n=1 Tax=Protomyces lactucae-debilis TaxID=2754530 RepID=A0A1Y2FSU6_PROLT|nr:kinase-like domain-containing protein [Protomyces lactucae-debilis]ORY87009.1 kinase-like domain-containing protein [Protomyces lactucae-debilis]